MILFLNFAPIEFMGGAERWMVETAKEVEKYERVLLVSVTPSLASLYSRLVLKRSFVRKGIPQKNIPPHISLTIWHFVPFTPQSRGVCLSGKEARLVYARFEILELALLFYFGGFSILDKTIAGLHSPLIYHTAIKFFERFHKLIYESWLWRAAISRTKKIHVISPADYQFLRNTWKLPQVVHIPNGIDARGIRPTVTLISPRMLRILFIGELSFRKGIDIVLQTIQKSPKNFYFSIAGDGEKKDLVESRSSQGKNVEYHGYCSDEKLSKLYAGHDVFFLPSRAEGMSLSMLRALAHGLWVVDSGATCVGLPSGIEYTAEKNDPEAYLDIFASLLKKKDMEKIDRMKIHAYTLAHYDKQIIYNRYKNDLFSVTRADA